MPRLAIRGLDGLGRVEVHLLEGGPEPVVGADREIGLGLVGKFWRPVIEKAGLVEK